MRFYVVTAKCGHVGRGKYLEIEFPIYAESMHDASQMCLHRPKVKKHLKNAITSVREVSFDTFKEVLADFRCNSFVRAHTKKETIPWLDRVQLLNSETEKKSSFVTREERISFLMKKNKLREESLYV